MIEPQRKHSAWVPGARGSTRCTRPQVSQASMVPVVSIESNLAIHVPTPRLALFMKEHAMNRLLRAAVLVLLTLMLAGCGYNALQTKDEQVKAAWSEVLNQYQRRADLVPNLVNTVKGFAQQEKDVLTQVTAARSRVGSIQATPELVDNPEAFARFQAAQRELGGALSRLLAVAESYPQLKSDANFRDLQAQLEGTENRIAVARNP